MKNNFYVYAHYKIGEIDPYYIGSGKGSRSKDINKSRNAYWKNTAQKHGVCIEIIKSQLNRFEALDLECHFIAMYGRKDLGEGPLVNMTDGWDGTRGHKHTKETKKLMSENHADMSGENNPNYGLRGKETSMYGRCAYDIWLEKYGKEEADKLREITKEKLRISGIAQFNSEEKRIQHSKAYGFNGVWLEHIDGRQIFVENQSATAKEYHLNLGHLNEIIHGKRKLHNGWTLQQEII